MTRWMGLALLLVTAMATATEKEAPAPTEPYAIELWGKAAYDATGQLSTLTFIDAEDYPAAFLARVEARLRQMPVEQKLVEGVPATFDTGILVSLTITPKAGGAASTSASAPIDRRPPPRSSHRCGVRSCGTNRSPG